MKKSLIFIPLMAVALVSCTSSGGGSKKKKSTTETSQKSSGTTASTHTGTPTVPTDPTVSPIEPPSPGPETYQGYRRVMTAPVDGKDYIYGIYQANLDKNIFMNGDFHRDEKGEYPYYFTTSDQVADAVKVRCTYTDDTHFDIQIIGGGKYTTYDGCYLEIYQDGKYTSLRGVTSFSSDYKGWTFLETYSDGVNSFKICTNVTEWTNTHGTNPVALATYESYESFSACTNNYFFDNFISHLWEPIEE